MSAYTSYTLNVPCPSEFVSRVIGYRGTNINSIRNSVRAGCMIKWPQREDTNPVFKIVTKSKSAAEMAKIMIEDQIKKIQMYSRQQQVNRDTYFGSQPQNNRFAVFQQQPRQQQPRQQKTYFGGREQVSQNRFAMFQEPKEPKQEKKELVLQFTTKKFERQNEQERWNLRKEMSEWLLPNGEKMFPNYSFTNKTTGRRVVMSGFRAVPWKEVDKEMKRRTTIAVKERAEHQKNVERIQKRREQRAGLKTAEFPSLLTKDMKKKEANKGIWSKGASKMVLSSEKPPSPVKETVIRPRHIVKQTVIIKKQTKKVVDSWGNEDDDEYIMRSDEDSFCVDDFDLPEVP